MSSNIAALYCRVSTRDKQTTKSQRFLLRNYAKAQGWKSKARTGTVYKWYEDHASSAPGVPRMGLESLLSDAKNGKVQSVIVVRLDRLGRDIRTTLALVYELLDLGVRVVSVTQNLDLSSAVGKFAMHLLAAIADMERDLIRTRVREGLDAWRSRNPGKRLGRPTNEKRHRTIRELHDSGMPVLKIADKMNCKRANVYASLKKTA